jgi:predicted phage terminase large subunit-like protein
MVSESLDQSINLLRDVKEELEYNNLIREFFGNLVAAGKWTDTDIVTANGVRVWARGSRQRIRGSKFRNRRPDIIILDDFESELNTETPEQRDKMKKWINAAVLPAVDPKRGKVFLIGTIIHEDAYLADIKNDDQGSLGWAKRMYKAGLPEKKALWNARYPLEKLKQIRDELAAQGYEHIYYQEYENEAITPGSGLAKDIKETEYEYFWSEEGNCWFINVDGEWRTMFTFLGYDPALGKAGGDATGEIVLGVDHKGHNHVLWSVELRIGVFELLERIFQKVVEWHVRNVNIESISFQEILRDSLFQMMPQKGIYFGLIDYKPKDKKATRLQGLTPYYYGGNISHNGFFPNLVSQLRMFPKTKYDDLLDALWMVLQGCSKPEYIEYIPGKLVAKRNKRGGFLFKKYNWMTGAPVED